MLFVFHGFETTMLIKQCSRERSIQIALIVLVKDLRFQMIHNDRPVAFSFMLRQHIYSRDMIIYTASGSDNFSIHKQHIDPAFLNIFCYIFQTMQPSEKIHHRLCVVMRIYRCFCPLNDAAYLFCFFRICSSIHIPAHKNLLQFANAFCAACAVFLFFILRFFSTRSSDAPRASGILLFRRNAMRNHTMPAGSF